MLVTVDGIVIGRRSIGEANCFLDILTKEYGVIEVTAHGVKKITSKNAGATALFSYSTFCMNKSALRYTINSTEPKYSFYKLSADLEALSLAAYFAELVKATSATEQQQGDILRFFAMALFELEKKRIPYRLIKAIFELRFCCMLGFLPDLRACGGCFAYESEEMHFIIEDGRIFCGECYDEMSFEDKESFLLSPTLLYTMRYIIYSDLNKIYGFKLGEKTLHELCYVTESYLLWHLDRGFKSLDYYKSLFEVIK